MTTNARATTPALAAMMIGTAFAWVSAFLPWLEAEALDESFILRPALDGRVGIAVWIELIALSAGLVVAIVRGQVGVIGPPAALWFNVSVLFWLAGYRVAGYIPGETLPEGAHFEMGLGASLGTGAAVLLVGSSLFMLVTTTWNVKALPRAAWSVPVAAVASVAVLAARDAPWFEIRTAQGFNWSMGFDVIPFFGDLLGLLILTGSIGVVVVALFPQRWLIAANALVGFAVIVTAMFAFTTRGLVESGTTWAVERASFLGSVEPEVITTNGPAYVAGGGALIMVASLMAWPRKRRALAATADVGTVGVAAHDERAQRPWVAKRPTAAGTTTPWQTTGPFGDSSAGSRPPADDRPIGVSGDDEPDGYQLPF